MESHIDRDSVREGEILAGKYRIERVLGHGGMGVVVAARHLELDERVAIKFLLPSTLTIPELVARFAREARAAVKIKSEHVARIIDVGKLENGAPYIIMEYLEGEDLSAWLAARGRLPPDQAVLFVLQACEAVAAAHAIGIVHRDIKPSNLFVVRLADGTLSVKVLDFGISKLSSRDPSDASITNTAALLGSPFYMPPEQMRSARDVDARSDIWALGAVLHELVTGVPPFPGTTLGEVMAQVLERAPQSLPAALVELEGVIAKCLQKQREHRYANVAELAHALLPFAPPRGRLSVERIDGMLRSTGGETSDVASGWPRAREGVPAGATRASWGGTHSGAHSAARRSTIRGRVVLLAGTGLAAVVAIAWFALGRPAAAPEKQGLPVASGPTPPVIPVSASPVASSEKHVEQPTGTVVVTPVPTPSAAVPWRRRGRIADAPAAVRPPAPSAALGPAPPIVPSAQLSGGTFEDRK